MQASAAASKKEVNELWDVMQANAAASEQEKLQVLNKMKELAKKRDLALAELESRQESERVAAQQYQQQVDELRKVQTNTAASDRGVNWFKNAFQVITTAPGTGINQIKHTFQAIATAPGRGINKIKHTFQVIATASANVRSTLSLVRSALPLFQSAFPLFQSAFPLLLRSAFPLLRSTFPLLRSAFPLFQSALSLFQSALPLFRHFSRIYHLFVSLFYFLARFRVSAFFGTLRKASFFLFIFFISFGAVACTLAVGIFILPGRHDKDMPRGNAFAHWLRSSALWDTLPRLRGS